MSDYLWDKQGETDAEVARLEALLGAFRHEPRPLHLPAEPATPEPAPARLLPFASRPRPRRLFAPAALAVAAVLLVASVLVAAALLRARVADREERAAAPESSQPKDERTAPPEVEWVMLEPPPGPGEVSHATPSTNVRVKDDKVAVETLPRVGRRRKEVQMAVVTGQRLRLPTAEPPAREGLTLEQMSTRGGASSLVESTRLLAKEQLIYALRLTGAKLRDVREKAQRP